MKLMIITLTIFFTTFLNAQNIEELYIKAKEYEQNGNFKEAMLTYKEIAKKERDINKTYIDEEIKITNEVITENLDPIENEETVETIEQILASNFNLYPYHENYLFPFSYDTKKRSDGRNQMETKFQLSVKKPILTNFFNLNETIYFGYTHTSWWQLYNDSAPFRETNYRPEIFVNIPYIRADKTALKGFKFGFLHESNGQDKPKSRSWNRLYLESYFQLGNLFAIPKVWYRIPEKEVDDDNPDIQDFLGYGDLTLVYPYKRHTLKLLLRNNMKFDDDNKGFAQLDWTFPFFGSKNTFGYIQLSNGYGDSLIDYDKEISRINFGISLSR